jgi:hypothetical protein
MAVAGSYATLDVLEAGLALLKLALGDDAGYREACTKMLRRRSSQKEEEEKGSG